jgi:hypothetical protein
MVVLQFFMKNYKGKMVFLKIVKENDILLLVFVYRRKGYPFGIFENLSKNAKSIPKHAPGKQKRKVKYAPNFYSFLNIQLVKNSHFQNSDAYLIQIIYFDRALLLWCESI